MIVSTPNKMLSQLRNPYHIQEFTVDELLNILSKNFTSIEIFGQQKSTKNRKSKISQITRFLPRKLEKLGTQIYKRTLCLTSSYLKSLYYKNPREFENIIANTDLPNQYKVKQHSPKSISEQYKVILAVCKPKR
jgi:hypothetical protein